MPAAWRFYACISYLVQTAWSQGQVSLTFNKDTVYIGDKVTLNCSFRENLSLRIFELDAFNGTRRAGSANCEYNEKAKTNGVFSGMTLEGCSTASLPGVVSVTFRASSQFELDYNCSVRVNDHYNFYDWTSNSARLTLSVLPEVPQLAPYNLIFNESDPASVTCESRNGKPDALLNLTISRDKLVLAVAEGNGTVSLKFPSSLYLRNTAASCSIMNHKFMNSTTRSRITIHYISTRREHPIEVFTGSGNITIDCAAEIESVPSAAFTWQIPLEKNFTEKFPNGSIITILKGFSGLLSCTAVNVVTLKAVVVTYHAIIEHTESTHSLKEVQVLSISLAIVSVVIVSSIMVVLLRFCCKRNRNPNETLASPKPLQENFVTADDAMAMKRNSLYERWQYQTTDDPDINEDLLL